MRQLRSSILPVILLIFMSPVCPAVLAQEGQSVLIRNVRLVDPKGDAEDVTANLLIRKGKLKLVTRDRIPADEADIVVDAQGRVLLGKLDLGQPPSFMIFDEDPRENVEILLDTRTHALFAVHGGEIIKNELPEVVDGAEETEPKRSGWLAYTPPPLVLPLSYQDSKKWNQWETKYFSGIFLAAAVLDRQRWVSQDDESETQVGDLREYDGGEIRGFRFGGIGTINFPRPWVWTFFAATHAFDKGFDTETTDDFGLFDYRLDIPLADWITMSLGKQKEPISMERLMSGANLPIQERAAVSDALLPSRNVGAVFSGAGFDRRMTWAGGAFNQWLVNSRTFDENASQVVGRVTWLPFITEDESNLLHLGVGARYSNAREGVRTGAEPEFNQSPEYVGFDHFPADGIMTWNLEASWRKGPFWLGGEYLSTAVDAPKVGDPVFSGYHVNASWVITGEMRPYNRQGGVLGIVPVSRSVYQGGKGAWEVGARWSNLDLSDGGIDGGEMDIFSLGVNWWLTPFMSVAANYRFIDLDRFGVQGESQGFMVRLILILQ